MLIKVLRTHPHGGQHRKAGTTYECPDKKAKVLIMIGKAEKYSTTQGIVERTTSMVAGDVPRAVEATPAAIRMAEDHGIDLTAVQGTGQDGKITKTDLEKLLA